MFLEHFGLIEQPFGVTPDPRFLFLGTKHREALASLVYGTETNRGFLALIAGPGMGKTSLLFHYLESMRPKARSAFLFNTVGDSRALMRHLLTDLGLDSSGKDLAGMHAMLNQVLMEEMNAGRRFILVIDEAQNLDEKVLESVRLLSNFETPWKKLIQIVIAGQPQLAESLARPSMAQLRQRISSVIRLAPFSTEEVNEYISHRLWIAGTSAAFFTVGARLLIAEHTKGIPRNINNLCFNSMSLAFAMGRKQVDSVMVREAITDLELAPANPPRQSASQAFAPERIFSPSQAIVLARKTEPRVQRKSWRLIPSMASLCAVLLLGLIAAAGWRGGMRTPPLDALPLVDAAELPTPPSSAATSPGITQPSEKPADASVIASTLAILVEKDDTLRHLSLQYLGRFDFQALIEICTLNPAITDPNHIEVGERIRMPLMLHPESAAPEQAAAETTAHTARGDKP